MIKLRALQQRFQDYLIYDANDIENDIVSTENALAEHRLGAYYNAYRIRLINTLAIDYSAIKKHLGAQAFEDLALDYLGKFPSTHHSIRWFGKNLPEYLDKAYDREDHEFLAELASFEWAQGLVFDANDEAVLFLPEEMIQVPPEAWANLAIQFKPAMQWLDLYWNVCAYSVAIDNSEPLPEPQREETPVRWLLWRKNQNPNWRSLEAHEAWAIEVALQGANFAELCAGLCEWISEDRVAITAAGFLKQWIDDELIVGISY